MRRVTNLMIAVCCACLLASPDARDSQLDPIAAGSDPRGPRVVSLGLGAPNRDQDLLSGHSSIAGNRLTVGFNEVVHASVDDLSLIGSRTSPTVTGSYTAPDGQSVTWTFAEPLSSDSYALILDDSVVDGSGNHLDGELALPSPGPSGNGLPGGDLRVAVDVVVGDEDSNGTTDVGDLARVVGQSEERKQQVIEHLGDTAAPLAPDAALLVANLGDADNDGTDEVATLQEAPRAEIRIGEADTASPSHVISLLPRFRWVALRPTEVPGGAAAPSFAALGLDRQTGAYRVWRWSRDGRAAGSWSFGKGEIPADVASWSSADGGGALAVLSRVPASGTTRVRRVDTATGRRAVTAVARGVVAEKLLVVADPEPSASRLVVPATLAGGGTTRLYRLRGDTLDRVDSLAAGSGATADVVLYEDPASGSERYGLLRGVDHGEASVEVRRTDGTLETVAELPVRGEARQLLAWPDSGGPTLGVLDVDPRTGVSRISSVGADGSNASSVVFGAGRAATAATSLRVGSRAALAVAERNPAVGVQQVQVRMTEGNQRVQTLPMAQSDSGDDWFLSHRAQGHTRFYPWHPKAGGFYGAEGFDRAGAAFAGLGAPLFTRSARHFDEDPWWPSELPVDSAGHQQLWGAREEHGIELGAGRSLLLEEVAEAWAAGEPMLAYYNDMSEATIAQEHPEWACHTADGRLATHETKGTYLDVTGPYGDIVEQRLLELADAGASGAYLDFRHMPAGGCYGTQLAAVYEAAHGTVPTAARTEDYARFLRFNADRLNKEIDGWRRVVQTQYPSFRVLTSTTSVPGLTRLEMTSELGAGGDTKSEFEVALARGQSNSVLENNPGLARPPDQVRMAFGWALLRDAHQARGGGLAHIWKAWSANNEQDRSFVGAVTTFGGVAAIDVREETLAGVIPKAGGTAQHYASLFSFGDRLSAALARTAPLGQAAVLYSENQRDARFAAGDVSMWRQVNLPALGGFEALTRSGMTPSILNDAALAGGVPGSIETLWVSTLDGLTDEQITRLDAFVARGGRLLSGDGLGLAWGTQPEYESSVSSLMRSISGTPQSVRVEGLPERAMAAAYVDEAGKNARMTVMITNQFDHIQTVSADEPMPPGGTNPQPPQVPAGATLSFDLARLGASDVGQVCAFNGVTGQQLVVESAEPGRVVVQLPAVDDVLQVAVTRC